MLGSITLGIKTESRNTLIINNNNNNIINNNINNNVIAILF